LPCAGVHHQGIVRIVLGIFGALAIASALGCGGSTSFAGGIGGSGVGVGASSGSVGASAGGVGMAMGVDDHRRDVEQWYQKRIARLQADDGWLSLVGLFPLPEGRHRFGSAADNECVFPASAPAHAGTIVVTNGMAKLEVEPGAGLLANGAPAQNMDLVTDKNEGDPTELTVGTIKFYVIDRPGTLYLRVKDANSQVRKDFKGIDRFRVNRDWLVAAHLERYDPPKKLTVPNFVGFEETVDCPGVLTFKVHGKAYRLEPMSESEEEMWIVFGDESNGEDTYGGGRFVYIPAPDAEGNTVIDFNKSYNPPCVFTPYATCPLPIRANVLPIRVEAGEKMWGETHH
jgi:uncharacterized protein (DUF1684 family)